jgi:tRNA 2-selenouridine synthase
MPRTFSSLHDILHHGADTIIDVRSPAEFAEDHVPGAINLPALSNVERAEVGTMYVQDSAFKARKMGAALVARNVASHLEGPLADKDGGWQPLVYCWRGGQRSGSFTSILQQIGWRADTVAGGYQSYRRLVSAMLHDDALPHNLILLDGNTGTGKTAILQKLQALDVQVIDLEGLAQHRGSLLGAQPGGQPSQKWFETRLAAALTACDPAQPVVMEAESSKIGSINLPPSLWAAMVMSPRIMVHGDLPDRAVFLAKTYRDIASDPTRLRQNLSHLRRIRGHVVVDRWEKLLADGRHEDLARALMAEHYDPAYSKARDKQNFILLGEVRATALDNDGLTHAARRVAALINPAT